MTAPSAASRKVASSMGSKASLPEAVLKMPVSLQSTGREMTDSHTCGWPVLTKGADDVVET